MFLDAHGILWKQDWHVVFRRHHCQYNRYHIISFVLYIGYVVNIVLKCHLLKVFSMSSHRRTSPTKRRWKALTWGFSWKQKLHIARTILQRSEKIILSWEYLGDQAGKITTPRSLILFPLIFLIIHFTGKKSNFSVPPQSCLFPRNAPITQRWETFITPEILLVLIYGNSSYLFSSIHASLCNTQ